MGSKGGKNGSVISCLPWEQKPIQIMEGTLIRNKGERGCKKMVDRDKFKRVQIFRIEKITQEDPPEPTGCKEREKAIGRRGEVRHRQGVLRQGRSAEPVKRKYKKKLLEGEI